LSTSTRLWILVRKSGHNGCSATISDDWRYLVDGFTPEVYHQVLSATNYLLSPSLSKEDGDEICGKKDLWWWPQTLWVSFWKIFSVCSYHGWWLPGSLPTWRARHGALVTLEILGFTKSLTLMIAMSGDVASFPLARGKMDLDCFHLPLLACSCFANPIRLFSSKTCKFVPTSMESVSCMLLSCGYSYVFLAYGEWQIRLWGVTAFRSSTLPKSFPNIASPQHPDPAWIWITKNPTVQISTWSSHLIWKYVCFQMVCSFLTCLKNLIHFFYLAKLICLHIEFALICLSNSYWINSGKLGVTPFKEV